MDIITTKSGLRIINDTYNANPSSMKAALMVLLRKKELREIKTEGPSRYSATCSSSVKDLKKPMRKQEN